MTHSIRLRGLVVGLVLGMLLRPNAVVAQTATGQVAGKVTDAETSRPLPLASVVILEAHRGDLSRQDGTFRFSELASGRYTVTVEQLGYDRFQQEIEVRSGSTVTLDVALRARAIALSGIVVTGALTPVTGKDVLSPVSVLSAAELDRKLTDRKSVV